MKSGRPIFSGNRGEKGGSFDGHPAPSSAVHAVAVPIVGKECSRFMSQTRRRLRLSAKNAICKQSMLMWWRSVVNLSFFLCLAACRARSSACDTLSRLCVRCVLCWLAFPLAPALGSTGSAAVGTALFVGFLATMADRPGARATSPLAAGSRANALGSRRGPQDLVASDFRF